jgi:hypothetical protein
MVRCQIAKVRVQSLPKVQAVQESTSFEDCEHLAASLRTLPRINKDGLITGQYHASLCDRHYVLVKDLFEHHPMLTAYQENREFPWGQ